MIESILIASLAALSTILAARIVSISSKNQKLNDQLNNKKIECYRNLISQTRELTLGHPSQDIKPLDYEDILPYASSGVLKSLGDIKQLFWRNNNLVQENSDDAILMKKYYAELIFEIRSDLKVNGFWSRWIVYKGFFAIENWFDIYRLEIQDAKKFVSHRHTRRKRGAMAFPAIYNPSDSSYKISEK
jgi:hypothetical protein